MADIDLTEYTGKQKKVFTSHSLPQTTEHPQYEKPLFGHDATADLIDPSITT